MNGYPGEIDLVADTIIATGSASANDGNTLSNIIFDFGNVLVDWNPAVAFVGRYSRRRIEQIMDNDCSGFYDANDMIDEGYSSEEAVAWIRNNHGEPWASMFRYYCDNLIDALPGAMPGARKLIKDLKSVGVGVWGLSNWSAETFHVVWESYDFLHDLNDKVISGYVHMRKPSAEIFEYALDHFNIDADQTLFVDDLGVNVLGANSAGIRGLRYEDPYQLRTTLINSGIAIPQVE